jgi:hypothetical protein
MEELVLSGKKTQGIQIGEEREGGCPEEAEPRGGPRGRPKGA